MATENAGAGDDPFDGCAHCGARFEPGVRYPATTRRGDDGTVSIYSFCDDECRAAWSRGA